MEFFPTIRGSRKLVLDCYEYVLSRSTESKYYWYCNKKRMNGCRGSLITLCVNKTHEIKSQKEHNHPPGVEKVNAQRVLNRISNRCLQTTEGPSTIILDEKLKADPDTRLYLPSDTAIKQRIKRVKKKNRNYKEPKTLEEFTVPEEFKTINHEPFLIADEVVGEERIIFFCRKGNLDFLQSSQFWIVDGTFKSVPTMFYQLFTIHCECGYGQEKKIQPMAYFLLTGKTEEIYLNLFKLLLFFADDHNITLEPQYIICDGERAIINALNHYFKQTQVKLCYFHVSQALWATVVKFKLSNLYTTDFDFRRKVKKLLALCYLPTPGILDVAKQMADEYTTDEEKKIYEYFITTYLCGKKRNNRSKLHLPPLYPHKMWSYYDQVLDGIPKTQNVAESWHRKINVILSRQCRNVFNFIQLLHNLQKDAETETTKILCGFPGTPVTTYTINRSIRIRNILDRYGTEPIENTLYALSYNVMLNNS